MKGGIESTYHRVIGQIPNDRNSSEVSRLKNHEARPDEFMQALKQFDHKSLDSQTKPQVAISDVKAGVRFSNHAAERMMHRGIRFAPEDLEKLNQAVQKAESKGAKDTLVLMNDSALIVSIKNKTVVTVMDRASLKENVFTNIDSTVVI
jgi:flagellar operon protein